jgi:hypothetical protein
MLRNGILNNLRGISPHLRGETTELLKSKSPHSDYFNANQARSRSI